MINIKEEFNLTCCIAYVMSCHIFIIIILKMMFKTNLYSYFYTQIQKYNTGKFNCKLKLFAFNFRQFYLDI